LGKLLADGLVEVKDRKTGDKVEVPVGDVHAHLLQVVATS
jgi:prolyl-tRNA synthetase